MKTIKDHIEPTPLKAGDRRVLINGTPPKVDYRVIAEEEYQLLLTLISTEYNQGRLDGIQYALRHFNLAEPEAMGEDKSIRARRVIDRAISFINDGNDDELSDHIISELEEVKLFYNTK